MARRIRVEGVVQGVFFRDWTIDAAGALGVTGWVRNLAGGGVELLAQGTSEQLDRLTAQLREGPALARVERLTAEDVDPEALTGFERRPTG